MKKNLKEKLINFFVFVMWTLLCTFGLFFSWIEDTLGLALIFVGLAIVAEHYYLKHQRTKNLGDAS